MILLVVFVTVLGNSSGLRRYLSKQEKSEENAPSEIDSLTEDGTEEGETEEIGSYAKEGFAGSDPSLQVGDDLRAFLQDSTFSTGNSAVMRRNCWRRTIRAFIL